MVRLGEFDTEQDPDCETDLLSGKDTCAPAPQDIGIQRVIVHPRYAVGSNSRFDDIGLVRLDQDAEFNGKFNYIDKIYTDE